MSPERTRHEHATDPTRTPRRVNRNQQAALVAKLEALLLWRALWREPTAKLDALFAVAKLSC